MIEIKSYLLEKDVYLSIFRGLFYINILQTMAVLFTQFLEPSFYDLKMPLIEIMFAFIVIFILFDLYLLVILQGFIIFFVYLGNKSRTQTKFTKNLETITNLLEESNNDN